MKPKWPKLASLAKNIYTLWFQFFDVYFASKGYPFKNILRRSIHTEEKPYGKSIHIGKEPYIYDIIIVSLIKSPAHKTHPLSNPLVKTSYFVHLASKFLLIKCLDHLRSFCSIKQMPIFNSKQHLYLSRLRILGIQLCFLT